ncbi:ABC transporter ATP-binding protein [Oliverpabstia intestinalis]|jgi:oligopeptide/dipeptide ABC transporter ATP-binding protein|uniref:Dipeptide ABC transporter ATP-binding protein n=1 Tax=Oliverpabstia intestinalis TaxID=2606633 RepID=A0A7X2TMS1_9FIRM|nr:dipeptide ABC transporter ATP-binding protein [Oliverpabstia intestinalis]MCI6420713.1 dipeptide ABC transporter ATP-binding protein [Blautia sp.]MDY3819213.1 dipeptide ABC transporter ATP-binding protein [Lachnospiraceae bacterium]MST67612.1 dipeptide ABC transporter ATP-binding protein [Oliverpabstia intestinalis]RST79153.1 dipeptide ABC transporter ATP-binding protein [Blautia sp. SG-772]
MSDTLLRVEDLKIYYPVAGSGFGKKEFVKAVDGVTFEVKKGEVFGIVGESGCGKSTLGRGVCKLENLTSGHVYLDGEDITEYNDRRMRSVRKKVQMVFQDPYMSLNPRMSVFDIIAEPLLAHHLYQDKADLEKKVLDLLHRVGLDDYHANRYPHEFSGGQRQRIGIARALAVEPSLIIADEPVSALDVSIQAQVLNLLNELKHDLDLTYIFVAHDLSVVEYISDRVGVMYLGNFVEVGEKEKIYSNPMHPYTQALLSAVPVPDPTAKRERILLEGSIPSAHKPPTGCKFHTRCPKCMECCKTQAPERYEVDDGHYVYCHLYDKERREQQK